MVTWIKFLYFHVAEFIKNYLSGPVNYIQSLKNLHLGGFCLQVKMLV